MKQSPPLLERGDRFPSLVLRFRSGDKAQGKAHDQARPVAQFSDRYELSIGIGAGPEVPILMEKNRRLGEIIPRLLV